MRAILIAALAAAAGCGGSSAAGPGTGGTNDTACSIVLTGAVTASLPCQAVVAGYDSSNNTGTIGINTSGGTVSNFVYAISIRGQPQTGTAYTPANSVSGGVAVTQNSTSNAWVSTGAATSGTFSLTLSSLSGSVTSGSQTVWTAVHGSATAVLEPTGSATGVVNVSVTF